MSAAAAPELPPVPPTAGEGAKAEVEVDAKDDSRSKVDASKVTMNPSDSTLNVMMATSGKVLMTLTEGGFQYLLAGARSTAGVKAGRYMFEVNVVESLAPAEVRGQQAPQPRQLVRVGVSTAGSSLLLDGPGSAAFDQEGYYAAAGSERRRVAQRFGRQQTVGVLLNLEGEDSSNAGTISLFRNGERLSEPQKLPQEMIGQALFPTVTYRNVTLQINLGPSLKSSMPFTCRSVADAAAEDVVLVEPLMEKGEVLFPVGLPEHGFFDWVDMFLKDNPSFVELSDRKVFEWAEKSGITRRSPSSGEVSSNDKPDMASGLHMLDDGTMRKVLTTLAASIRRNYIVPELASNLLPADRAEAARNFAAADFKRTACVVMGNPSEAYDSYVKGLLLQAKEAQAAVTAGEKATAAKKQAAFPVQSKENSALVKETNQQVADGAKAEGAEGAKAEAEDGAKADGADGAKAESADGAKPEGADVAQAEGADGAEATAAVAAKEENKIEEEQPIELSEEEKALKFRPGSTPDVQNRILSSKYAGFSLPSADEGFDEVRYDWATQEECSAVLQAWVMERKMTQRVEELVPGEGFKTELATWQKTYQDWKRLHGDWRESARKTKPEGDGAEAQEVNVDDVEVADIANVCDVGGGQPLFSRWIYEDWTLLSTRYELHLLLHSFKKDLNDSDRPSFTQVHLEFYFNKYFGRALHPKYFGVGSVGEVLDLVKDTLVTDKSNKFLRALLAEDTQLEQFVKLTEEHRRERQQRIDAGDETAKLEFTRPPPSAPQRSEEGQSNHQQSYGGYGGSRGGGGDRYGGGDCRGGTSGYGGGGGYRGGQQGGQQAGHQGGYQGGHQGGHQGTYQSGHQGGYQGTQGGHQGGQYSSYGGASRQGGDYRNSGGNGYQQKRPYPSGGDEQQNKSSRSGGYGGYSSGYGKK